MYPSLAQRWRDLGAEAVESSTLRPDHHNEHPTSPYWKIEVSTTTCRRKDTRPLRDQYMIQS